MLVYYLLMQESTKNKPKVRETLVKLFFNTLIKHTYLLLTIFTLTILSNTKAFSDETPIFNSEKWKTDFDGQRAWNHVAILASDSLGGRYSGFQGCDKSDAYITSHYRKLGLKAPFGEDGFYHNFTYGAGEYAMPSSLILHYPEGKVDSAFLWEEFNIYKYSGFGKVKGRIVFAGYGISAPEKGWDEYENLDIEGAIVLVMRGTPAVPDIKWDKESASGFKSTTALEKGAVGFLMTESEVPKYATITEKYYREEMPAAWISSILADSLLKETGKSISEWRKQISEGLKPVSQTLSTEIELQVSGKYYPERQTRNIVAVLPGTDPKLKHEAILIGAHMDHHGIDAAGNVYPGADDNASGTANVMEMAQKIVESSDKFKQTLMFAGFAAEEEGLVGSKELVKSLPIGDYELVAMFNMDMVGQGDGSVGIGGINEFPHLGELMFTEWEDSSLSELKFWGIGYGSDQASFRAEGIPSYVIGARGKHPNYHTPNDTAGAIKPYILKNVGDLLFHCVNKMANHEASLTGDVGKVNWLIHTSGAVRFLDPSDSFIPDFETVPGVDYPKPVIFVNVGSGSKKSDLSEVIANLEQIRELSLENSIPFMADSNDVDFGNNTSHGVTAIIQANNLPENVNTLKGLRRLGVSFADISDMVGKKLKSKTIKKLTAISNICNEAGIRPLLTNSNPETGRRIAKIFSERLLFKTDLRSFDWDEMESLIESGCFVVLTNENENLELDYANLAENIKANIKNNESFIIPADSELVKALIDAEFEDNEIKNLLQNNLRYWLQAGDQP